MTVSPTARSRCRPEPHYSTACSSCCRHCDNMPCGHPLLTPALMNHRLSSAFEMLDKVEGIDRMMMMLMLMRR